MVANSSAVKRGHRVHWDTIAIHVPTISMLCNNDNESREPARVSAGYVLREVVPSPKPEALPLMVVLIEGGAYLRV